MTNLSTKDIKRIAWSLEYTDVCCDNDGCMAIAPHENSMHVFNPKAPEHVLAMLVQMKMDEDLDLILAYDHKWWVHNDGHDYGANLSYDTPEDAIIAAYLEYLG